MWLLRALLLLRGEIARSSASGPCSPGESVAFDPQLSEPSTRSPLGLSPLQGIPHFGRRLRFHNLPLTGLLFTTYETWEKAPLRVFPRPKDGSSLARQPAFLRFVAFSFTRSFGFDADLAYRFASGGMPRHRCTVSILGPSVAPYRSLTSFRFRPTSSDGLSRAAIVSLRDSRVRANSEVSFAPVSG